MLAAHGAHERAMSHDMVEADAIRALSARWLAAADQRDAAGVAAFYADDGAFLAPNAPAAMGRDSVRAVWATLFATPGLALAWSASSVQVADATDLAYEMGSYTLGLDGPNGRVEDDGKYLVVWRKTAAGWQVAADMFNSSRPVAG